MAVTVDAFLLFHALRLAAVKLIVVALFAVPAQLLLLVSLLLHALLLAAARLIVVALFAVHALPQFLLQYLLL